LPRRRSPSRGKPRRGSRPARHAEGLQPSGKTWRPATMGCSTGYVGGELSTSITARPRRGGAPSLLASRPTHAFSHCLTHPRRNRRWTRGAASHAASRGAVAFVAPPAGGLAPTRRRRRRCGCGSLPAPSRKREGYRTPGASKGAHGKRGPTRRHGLVLVDRAPRSTASEDRTLEVVLARHGCGCRSRRTVTGAEKRTHLHFTRSGSVQGRAPSSQLQRTKVRSRG